MPYIARIYKDRTKIGEFGPFTTKRASLVDAKTLLLGMARKQGEGDERPKVSTLKNKAGDDVGYKFEGNDGAEYMAFGEQSKAKAAPKTNPKRKNGVVSGAKHVAGAAGRWYVKAYKPLFDVAPDLLPMFGPEGAAAALAITRGRKTAGKVARKLKLRTNKRRRNGGFDIVYVTNKGTVFTSPASYNSLAAAQHAAINNVDGRAIVGYHIKHGSKWVV